MSVLAYFRKPSFLVSGSAGSDYWVHLEGMRVKFVYESHRVKVKVTKSAKLPNPAMQNFDRQYSKEHRAMKFACRTGFWDMAVRMV